MPKPRAAKQEEVAPEIKYPAFKCEMHLIEDGGGLKADDAVNLIGFESEPEDGKWGDDYFGKDFNEQKFRVKYNTRNREWTRGWSLRLMQDMLMKRWHGKNGETMSFGTSGRTLSAQHRLLALIFAEQARLHKKHAEYWKQYWDGPVEIDAVLMFGVSEDAETVNTLDNVKPRTFADALFSDPERFKNLKGSHRSKAVKAADFAVRLLWERTGMKKNPYRGKLTSSEAAAFINAHPHVVHAVDHIIVEATAPNSVLNKYASAGMAAGFMYLMGCSKSDGDHYHNARRQGEVDESGLDWSMWKKAAEFWGVVSKGHSAAIREAVAALRDKDSGEDPSSDEKMAVLLKAWAIFSGGGKPTSAAIGLTEDDYSKDDDGIKTLKTYPNVGGIDLGSPKARGEEEEEDGDGDEEEEGGDDTSGGGDAPTPEQSGSLARRRGAASAVDAALQKRFGAGSTSNGKPAPPPTPAGTQHDFVKEPEPKLVVNKEGTEIKVGESYRALGIEGQTFKVTGFGQEAKAGALYTIAKTVQTHGKHLPRNTPVDDLLPEKKPQPADAPAKTPRQRTVKPGNASK